MNVQQVNEILARYNANEATADEKVKLDNWYARENLKQMQHPELEDYERIRSEIYATLAQYPEQSGKIAIKGSYQKLYTYLATAAAIAAIAFGIYFFKASRHPEESTPTRNLLAKDISPGKNIATLTLSNGKTFTLSDAKSGVVIGDDLRYNDNTLVTSSTNNQPLPYSKGDHNGMDEITLTTPRGGTYAIVLSDGTKVWLNAASNLTYTANLNKRGQRQVKLNGEAFFEVAKDKAHPFVVISRGQEVEVLGTHFNVNAYIDEPFIATTLLEGSVKVIAKHGQQFIKPGEQSLNNGHSLKVSKVDVETVIDWKQGDFFVNRVNFKQAMRKIARWYDVEVIYDTSISDDIESGGWISRNNNLSEVLKLIEASGQVHFKIEGRKIYVYQ